MDCMNMRVSKYRYTNNIDKTHKHDVEERIYMQRHDSGI